MQILVRTEDKRKKRGKKEQKRKKREKKEKGKKGESFVNLGVHVHQKLPRAERSEARKNSEFGMLACYANFENF